ncbi:hypothetical protein LCGC14_2982350 [marine sediment metagenome]|uniref:Uncharacterized protein n=1 Tax=marine sediment metagenome TaxID=412755 RepID=A0A0F8ZXG8_9ZZZZ|nr:hypothetical protein [bacterium]
MSCEKDKLVIEWEKGAMSGHEYIDDGKNRITVWLNVKWGWRIDDIRNWINAKEASPGEYVSGQEEAKECALEYCKLHKLMMFAEKQ